MAYSRWSGGANDGNWSTAGNWDTSVGGGSAPPNNGDDVYIDATSQNITTFPAAIPAGTALGTIYISPGFTGSIGGGASGSANITCGTLNISMGGSSIYLGTGTRTTTNIDDTGRGKVFITGGTNTTITVGKNARVDVGGSAVATTLKNAGGTVFAAYSATAFTTVVNSGTLFCARAITTATVTPNGLLVANDTTNSTFVTTANIYGRWNHQAKGNLATVNLYPGGTLDAKGAVYAFTVGSTAFEHWVGSVFDRTGTAVAVTVSNETTIGARSVA